MTNAFLLADGIPAPLIFFGFVAVIMAISAVFGKANGAKSTPRVPLGGAQSEAERVRLELQRRAAAQRQNLARNAGRPPAMPQQTAAPRGRQAKANRKVAARVAAVAPAAPAVRAPAHRPAMAIAAPAAPIVNRKAQSELSRNLRLLLQRGGVREALLLNEVLGPPKSLRDDA